MYILKVVYQFNYPWQKTEINQALMDSIRLAVGHSGLNWRLKDTLKNSDVFFFLLASVFPFLLQGILYSNSFHDKNMIMTVLSIKY